MTGTRIAYVVAATVIGSLFAAGCSSSAPSQSAENSLVPVSTGPQATTTTPTPETRPADSAIGTTTVHSGVAGSTPATPPSPSSTAPAPPVGEPPVLEIAPVFTLPPIGPGGLQIPAVQTLTATTHFTCQEAANKSYNTGVTYTTRNATSVNITIDGLPFASSQPPAATIPVPLHCGDDQVIVVTAQWPGGTEALSKTIVIKVDGTHVDSS